MSRSSKKVYVEENLEGHPKSARCITEAEMDLRKLLKLHMDRGELEIADMIRKLLNIKVQKDFPNPQSVE